MCYGQKEQDVAFDKIKEAAVTREDHPVTYASRALTQAEQHYSQTEKELLAQVFGLENNHQCVYGRKAILYTDHKPSVSISRKPLAFVSKRLQRLLRLQQYDAEIRYRSGREMCLAARRYPSYQQPIQAYWHTEIRDRERNIKYSCRRLCSYLWVGGKWNQARNG